MDTITITVAENDPDVVVSATLNEEAVTITLVEAQDGETGAAGVGVPTGGGTNDILKKTSGTNYATEWETPTSAATASAIVRRDASGGAAFDDLTAATLVTTSRIHTTGATAKIYTIGASANIETQHATAAVKSHNFKAYDSTAGAALRNSAGTAVLTWGVSGQNLTVTARTEVTLDATSYTFGAGAAYPFRTALLIEVGDLVDLDSNVESFLLSSSVDSLKTAINGDYTGTGFFVCDYGPVITNPTITTPTIAQINGDTLASGTLTLQSTTHATKGKIIFGTSAYDEANNRQGFGTASPALPLHLVASNNAAGMFRAQNTAAGGYCGFELYGDAGTQLAGFGVGCSASSFFPAEMYLGTNTAKSLRFYTTSAANVRASISAAGGFSLGTTTDAGATNLLVAGKVTATGGVVFGAFTVGTFPTATTYLAAVVTDSLAPVVGVAVAAGGSAKCIVTYNGSAKIVTAVI